MTRKDYEKIAAVLAEVKPPEDVREPIKTAMRSAWHATVATMAQMLALDNPRFDRARFYAACGVQS